MNSHRLSQPLAVTLGELVFGSSVFGQARRQAAQRAGDRVRLRYSDGYTIELSRIRGVNWSVDQIGRLIEGARKIS